MLYAIMVHDQVGAEAARTQHRDGHLDHFRNHKARIALAGPLTNDDGKSIGSLVVYVASSKEEAVAFICADPFHGAGVWHEPTVACFKGSIIAPELFNG